MIGETVSAYEHAEVESANRGEKWLETVLAKKVWSLLSKRFHMRGCKAGGWYGCYVLHFAAFGELYHVHSACFATNCPPNRLRQILANPDLVQCVGK
jgi:hypothetical protein